MSIDYDVVKALYDRDITSFQSYITSKSDVVKDKDWNGETLLHLAAHQGFSLEAEILLKNNADINARNKDGLTPLHLATDYTYKESDIKSLLLRNGADVNAKSKDGKTPLHFAVLYGRIDAAEMFIADRADINARTNDGSTPIHYASANYYEEMIDLLATNGADVNVKNNKDWHPLSIAMKKKQINVAKALIKYGSDVNVIDPQGNSPLHLAVTKNCIDVISILAGAGAYIDILDSNNRTPLQLARYQNKKNIGKLLISLGAMITTDTSMWLFGDISIKTTDYVPEWNHYGHFITDATPAQLIFYYKWLEAYKNGNILSIDGNIAYIQIYIDTIITEFQEKQNVQLLFDKLQKLEQSYPNYPSIIYEILYLRYQGYLYCRNFNKAWDIKRQLSLSIEDILYLRSKCSIHKIDGEDILRLSSVVYNRLTRFGTAHKSEIANYATDFLDDFDNKHTENLIENFCKKYDFWNLDEVDISRLRENINDEDFKYCIESYKHEKEYCTSNTYQPLTIIKGATNTITGGYIPTIIKTAVIHTLAEILRNCENRLREKYGLPYIGEGWTSETELFYLLKEAFPDEIIIQHASPKWLGKQHLDIYFPERNIACEYQGIQHYIPVNRFGGHDGFIELQKRDARKRELCNKNGCLLIYVAENYNINELINQLHIELYKIK